MRQDDRAVEARLFTQYAESDLDRWRVLVDCDVAPVDPRWGIGRVADVRWGPWGRRAWPSIQIRVCYGGLGTVVFVPETFAAHHRSVAVPQAIASVISSCFAGEDDPSRRAALLERHARELRAEHDRARLRRSEELRRRVLERGEDRR